MRKGAHACIKKSFGAGTKQCVVLLALALVCNFYLQECLLSGVMKRKL